MILSQKKEDIRMNDSKMIAASNDELNNMLKKYDGHLEIFEQGGKSVNLEIFRLKDTNRIIGMRLFDRETHICKANAFHFVQI